MPKCFTQPLEEHVVKALENGLLMVRVEGQWIIVQTDRHYCYANPVNGLEGHVYPCWQGEVIFGPASYDAAFAFREMHSITYRPS